MRIKTKTKMADNNEGMSRKQGCKWVTVKFPEIEILGVNLTSVNFQK